jgi:hypothetical protein
MAQLLRTVRALGKLARAGNDLAADAVKLGETAVASGTVVGHRLGFGWGLGWPPGLPAIADPREFTLMTTEKIDAASDVATGMIGRSFEIGATMARLMVGQTAGWTRAAMALGTAATPQAAVAAHHRWAVESMGLATTHGLRLAAQVADLSGSMVKPVHSRATGNARRLDRRRGKA